MTSPFTDRLEADVPVVATAGNTDRTIIGEAPAAATVTAVGYVPDAALTGAATNSRTLNLYNRGTAGTGTTLVATLALVVGVDLVDNDRKAITLSATAANLQLAAGDVLEWESLAVGTGITDPGGRVIVEFQRNYV